MLAALGRSFISVHQRPVVAVLATGDELVDIDEKPTPWQIVSSNSYSIAAQISECGGIPLQIGIAKDTREDLVAKFKAATRADIIISSGGVSVGDYDLVKDINKIIDWKNKTEARMTQIEQEFQDLKAEFDKVHNAVLGKIGEYDKNILDVGAEIKAMEKVFSKVLPQFTDNVNELTRITDTLKKK
jgi:hypothetical protein